MSFNNIYVVVKDGDTLDGNPALLDWKLKPEETEADRCNYAVAGSRCLLHHRHITRHAIQDPTVVADGS